MPDAGEQEARVRVQRILKWWRAVAVALRAAVASLLAGGTVRGAATTLQPERSPHHHRQAVEEHRTAHRPTCRPVALPPGEGDRKVVGSAWNRAKALVSKGFGVRRHRLSLDVSGYGVCQLCTRWGASPYFDVESVGRYVAPCTRRG